LSSNQERIRFVAAIADACAGDHSSSYFESVRSIVTQDMDGSQGHRVFLGAGVVGVMGSLPMAYRMAIDKLTEG
jgi:hypothetical protein